MVYDSVDGSAIVFCGDGVGTRLNDVHKLDLTSGSEAWSEWSPSVSPAKRLGVAGCFDVERNRAVFLGGQAFQGATPNEEGWAFYPYLSVDHIQPLGECEIIFNGVSMGLSKGGCEVQITDSVFKTTVDKYGASPVRGSDVGVNIQVRTNLIEASWNILAEAWSSTGSRGSGPDRISFGSGVGDEVDGKELRLHPRNEPTGDYDVIVYLAVPEIDSVVPFSIEGERIFPVKWVGLIDESRSGGDMLFRIGNLS